MKNYTVIDKNNTTQDMFFNCHGHSGEKDGGELWRRRLSSLLPSSCHLAKICGLAIYGKAKGCDPHIAATAYTTGHTLAD